MPVRIWGEEDVPWTFFEREITSTLFFFQRLVVATQLFSPQFFRAMLEFDVFFFSDGLEKNHQLDLNGPQKAPCRLSGLCCVARVCCKF